MNQDIKKFIFDPIYGSFSSNHSYQPPSSLQVLTRVASISFKINKYLVTFTHLSFWCNVAWVYWTSVSFFPFPLPDWCSGVCNRIFLCQRSSYCAFINHIFRMHCFVCAFINLFLSIKKCNWSLESLGLHLVV